MKKEEIIAKIIQFDPTLFKYNEIYNVVKNEKWDIEELNKKWNLTLHIIWRKLK